MGLRVQHHVEQIEAGSEPDDHIDPATLTPLTRSYLKEAFRAVASVQKGISTQVNLGVS
jgi:CBS domain-containing protein